MPATQRRIAYDSLGVYQALQQRREERDLRSPEAWAEVLEYSQTISTILGADGSGWVAGMDCPGMCWSSTGHQSGGASCAGAEPCRQGEGSCLHTYIHDCAFSLLLCRAVDVAGDALFSLQERALWELLSLFFLELGRAQTLVAQVGAPG